MRWLALGLVASAALTSSSVAWARAEAEVVLLVDNSASMAAPGGDPERLSLLTAMLFADVVPGNLAVVRLENRDQLPSRDAGETAPCPEQPSRQCGVIEPVVDWELFARRQRLGALPRPAQGDEAYKRQLEELLRQEADNTYAHLQLRVAQRIFERQDSRLNVPRYFVWLTDGQPQDEERVVTAVEDMELRGLAQGTAFVFGQGETAAVERTGLATSRVHGPESLVDAFTRVFRGIVQAPFTTVGTADQPVVFEMQPAMEGAWVVVVGDDTLRGMKLRRPDGTTLAASHTEGRLDGTGAYQVAFVEDPMPGAWTLTAEGGGSPVYAVLQRVAMEPVAPRAVQAMSGVPFRLKSLDAFLGRLQANPAAEDLVVEALVEGTWVLLRPASQDESGRDLYEGVVTFRHTGRRSVEFRTSLRGVAGETLISRSTLLDVDVVSELRYEEKPFEISLGGITPGKEKCERFVAPEGWTTSALFELRVDDSMPAHHHVRVRKDGETVTSGQDGKALLSDGAYFDLCVGTTQQALPTEDAQRVDVQVVVSGTEGLPHGLPLLVTWNVREPFEAGAGSKSHEAGIAILALLFVAMVLAGLVYLLRRPQKQTELTGVDSELPAKLRRVPLPLVLAFVSVFVVILALFFSRFISENNSAFVDEVAGFIAEGRFDEVQGDSQNRVARIVKSWKEGEAVSDELDESISRLCDHVLAALRQALANPGLDLRHAEMLKRVLVLGPILESTGTARGQIERDADLVEFRATFLAEWLAVSSDLHSERYELLKKGREGASLRRDFEMVKLLNNEAESADYALLQTWDQSLLSAESLEGRLRAVTAILRDDDAVRDSGRRGLVREHLMRWVVRSVLELESNRKVILFASSLVPYDRIKDHGKILSESLHRELVRRRSYYAYKEFGERMIRGLAATRGLAERSLVRNVLQELFDGSTEEELRRALAAAVQEMQDRYVFNVGREEGAVSWPAPMYEPLEERISRSSATGLWDILEELEGMLTENLLYQRELSWFRATVETQLLLYDLSYSSRRICSLLKVTTDLRRLSFDVSELNEKASLLSEYLQRESTFLPRERDALAEIQEGLAEALPIVNRLNEQPDEGLKEEALKRMTGVLARGCRRLQSSWGACGDVDLVR